MVSKAKAKTKTEMVPPIECPVLVHVREIAKLRRVSKLVEEEGNNWEGTDNPDPSEIIEFWNPRGIWTGQILPIISAHEAQAIRKTATSIEGAIFQIMVAWSTMPVSEINWRDDWRGYEAEKREAEEREFQMEVCLEHVLRNLLTMTDDKDIHSLTEQYMPEGMLKTQAFENGVHAIEQGTAKLKVVS